MSQDQAGGGAIVNLDLRVNGRVHGQLRVRLGGVPLDGGGGLSMTGSQVDLALAGQPSALQGRIIALQGQEFDARVSNGATKLDIHAQLQIDPNTNTVTGTLSGSPATA